MLGASVGACASSLPAATDSTWPWYLPLCRDKVTNGCWLTEAKPNLAGGCFKPC